MPKIKIIIDDTALRDCFRYQMIPGNEENEIAVSAAEVLIEKENASLRNKVFSSIEDAQNRVRPVFERLLNILDFFEQEIDSEYDYPDIMEICIERHLDSDRDGCFITADIISYEDDEE